MAIDGIQMGIGALFLLRLVVVLVIVCERRRDS